MSDYLWDGEGEADEEVARLEALLAPLAYDGAPPALPSAAPRRSSGGARRSRARWWVGGTVAGAAALALLLLLSRRPPDARASWAAHIEGGAARVDGERRDGDVRLALGAWLESDASRVRLQVPELGTVELAPGARARIVSTFAAGPAAGAPQTSVELARGALTAHITAPPRRFAVLTRFVRAIDLGCAFSLEVDEAGQGRLVVDSGSVALTDDAREVVVPAGASCGLDQRGPGLPVYADAATELRAAARRARDDEAALATLLARARPKDALTLRALADGATPEVRARVAARLDALAAPVPPITPRLPAPKPSKPTAPKPAPKPTAPKAPPLPPRPPSAPPATPARGDGKLTHDALKELERSTPP